MEVEIDLNGIDVLSNARDYWKSRLNKIEKEKRMLRQKMKAVDLEHEKCKKEYWECDFGVQLMKDLAKK